MIRSKTIKKITLAFIIAIAVSSCAKKLDLTPTNSLTPDKTYATADGYQSVLAKIYGGLASGGNQGPAGQPDISGGLDEGSQIAFIRPFFNCEELPTDEAVVAWNDQTIHDYHNLAVTSADPFLKGTYARPMYNITLSNEYLRYSTDAEVAAHGITGVDAANIKSSRAEVRFLRAFNYWLMMDLFGKSSFVTEADVVGGPLPKEISRINLFKYIVGELEAIAVPGELAPAKTIEYGRVDQAAAWALLARVYLNDSVYTGTKHYDSAAFYASKVINAGYSLQPNYARLFMADNDSQKDEFIFAVPIDGLHTQGYGNTTFFAHGASGDEATSDYGVTGGGWYGYRATAGLLNLFADKTGATDKRAMFTTSKYGTGSAQLVINDITNFDQGPHVAKYINKRFDGGTIHDPTGYFADIDFPVFRLSEMYLIYAEAAVRGYADKGQALTYLNLIRARAYGGTANGQLTSGDLSPQLVLDERGRELYWEGHRRTDLIRYDLLTTSTYLWPWKGGVASGTAVDSKYNLFPIPASVLQANSFLTQNPGYN